MTRRQIKTGYFVLEGLNSFGTTYFFYYLYFYLHNRFGFDDASNLQVSALYGFVYTGCAAFGGWFAHRVGPFPALRLGYGIMALALILGARQDTPLGLMGVVVLWAFGICFTWPTLESLASEKETRAGLQTMVGVYNLVWAATAALAYFVGGTLLQKWGMASLFWLPIGLNVVQWLLLEWLRSQSRRVKPATGSSAIGEAVPEAHPHPEASRLSFLRMAWIANPFAYTAINTVAAVIPALAGRMDLTLGQAGVYCSLWFFARMGSFALLWFWPGWHYRFGWLAASYVAMIGSFLAILLVSDLWIVAIAQLVFGLTIGLFYYSSLFYAMDIGEAKSDHSGLHEAAIGAGIFAGPALGALALRLWPAHPNAGAWAVSLLLLVGGVAILVLRLRSVSGARRLASPVASLGAGER